MFNFKNVKTRLSFWFLVIGLIPLTIAITIIYFQRVEVIKQRNYDKLVAIRDLKVNILEKWLDERIGDVRTVSGDRELTDLKFVYDNKINDKQNNKVIINIRRILHRYLGNYSDYDEIFIINPRTGRIIVSTDTNIEGHNRSGYEDFTIPMNSKEMYVKDVYYSKTMHKHAILFSIPIFDKKEFSENIIGILVARVDLENSLYEILNDRVGLGKTGETFIVNKQAIALSELIWYPNAPLNLLIKADPAIKASKGESGIIEATDYRSEKVLSAFTFIPKMNWGFVCKQDLSEVNEPIRQMINNFIIIFCIFLIVVWFISIFISKSITHPILAMANVAERISKGEYAVRNKKIGVDELGFLAKTFNNMASIVSYRLSIQDSVSKISKIIIGKSSIKTFAINLLKELMNTTNSNMAVFYMLNKKENKYKHIASIGSNEELLKPISRDNPEGEFGAVISSKEINYIKDIPEDTIFKFKTSGGDAIPREIITIPILNNKKVIAIISLVSINTFSKESYDILNLSWISINTSFSNLLANDKTRMLAEDLSKKNMELESKSIELQKQTKEVLSKSEELKEQYFQIEAKNVEVEEANKLKSEFLSNMSHELRTPLNSIMALSKVLVTQSGDKLNDEENSYLEVIERNGKNLLVLINDILDLSKIEAGKMDMYPEDVSLSSLLNNIKENLKPLLEEQNIIIKLNIPDKLPKIETDENRLLQTILNIAGNSIKFTESGSVVISVKYHSGIFTIDIEDTGIGIPENEIPYIFDEFRQVDGSSTRQYSGTGLGLSIVKKIILLLNGEIKVKSEVGKGSVFSIMLPEKWQEGTGNGIKDQDPSIKTKSKPDQLSFRDNKKTNNSGKHTILIVEDNPDNMITVRAILKDKFVIIEATTGKDGIQMVQNQIPDLILLDMFLPGMHGVEVVHEMKKNEKTKNIPIIALTASVMMDDLKKFKEFGCDDYVTKPIDANELLVKIAKYVN